ncbi:MAG TPA: hypothetical protein VGX24_17670 [Pyrinomonadaceae bacterium]|jgi:hypothetical protein|nr:hypothetical protein [Pyrinomonadaceae bacterium]
MSKDDLSRVKITVIELDVTQDMLVDTIRAVTGQGVMPARTMRPLAPEPTPMQETRSQPTELPSGIVPRAALPPAQEEKPAAQSASKQTTGNKKKSTTTKKTDGAASTLKANRKAKLDEIVAAKGFDDHDRYSAAIGKDDISTIDLAALVTRLAQVKFGVDEGMAPAEVRYILKERFFINVSKRAMEETMKKAPSTFFAAAPADFDKRAKLYRPMKDCLKRVEDLLSEFNDARIDSVDSNHTEAAVN